MKKRVLVFPDMRHKLNYRQKYGYPFSKSPFIYVHLQKKLWALFEQVLIHGTHICCFYLSVDKMYNFDIIYSLKVMIEGPTILLLCFCCRLVYGERFRTKYNLLKCL